MNSTTEPEAKVAEELNQSYQNSDIKEEGIQHIKARLGESLEKKWESKIIHNTNTLEVRIDSLLAKKTRSCCCRGKI
jgi:hypothetical protein